MSESDKEHRARVARWRKRAALVGMLLAVLCKSLPADYQGPCHQLASICTGGIL